MILRGIFWMGLVWLCMTHGPDLGFGPSPALACASAACADPVAAASDSWRRTTLTRLAALKIELNAATAQRHGLVGVRSASESEAVRRISGRLAAAANRLRAP
jgi:hypothetical protein